jgi:hypothetical protein
MAILLSGILLLAICTPAVAQEAGAVAQNSSWLSQNLTWLSHMAMTAGGAGLAMLWAYEAFGRREVNVADVPTHDEPATIPAGQFDIRGLRQRVFPVARLQT